MIEGKLRGIWTRKEWGGVMTSFESAKLVESKGIANAVSFGSRRQVTIIEEEVWESIMKLLSSDLPPFTRRANLMVNGIKLKETRGQILIIGGCRIQIEGETKPCASMDKKLSGLREALKPNWNGGVFGSVLGGGEIFLGDKVFWNDLKL